MLGFRGCRLGNVRPEISEMQALRHLPAAAAVLKDESRSSPRSWFHCRLQEGTRSASRDHPSRCQGSHEETGKKFAYTVGTMIEVPRGALTADENAESAEFFSFGTNDLTQTCLGMSRDDSGSFIPPYQRWKFSRPIHLHRSTPLALVS